MPPSRLLVRWTGGWSVVEDADAIAAAGGLGVHEATLGLGTVQSRPEMETEAAAQLAEFAHVRVAVDLTFDPTDESEVPYASGWRPGDTVLATSIDGGDPIEVPTLSMTVKFGQGRSRGEFTPVLGDEILPPDVAIHQASKKMTNGTFRGASKLATPVANIRTNPSLVIEGTVIPPTFGDQLAYWPFSEGTGDPVDVVGPYDLDPVSGSTVWLPDSVFGTVVDGTQATWHTTLATPQVGYTLAGWLYTTDVPAGGKAMGWTDRNVGGIGFFAQESGDILFAHGNYSLVPSGLITVPDVILPGIWQYWAATWDGTTVRLYMGAYGSDFEEIATLSNTATAIPPGGGTSDLYHYSAFNGSGGDTEISRWPGPIGPWGVWSGPLSEADLQARFLALS